MKDGMVFNPSFDRCDTVVVAAPRSRKGQERIEAGGRILGALMGVTMREARWDATVIADSEGMALGFKEEGRPDELADDDLKDYSGLVRLALGMKVSGDQIYFINYSALSIKIVFDSVLARWCLVQPGYCGAYASKGALIGQLRKIVPHFDGSDFAQEIMEVLAV